MSTETIRLIRDGEKGGEVGMDVVEDGDYIPISILSPPYQSLYCHRQNDSCIKTGSDESPFNVSLILRGKVTRWCPKTTTFEEKGELKRHQY